MFGDDGISFPLQMGLGFVACPSVIFFVNLPRIDQRLFYSRRICDEIHKENSRRKTFFLAER